MPGTCTARALRLVLAKPRGRIRRDAGELPHLGRSGAVASRRSVLDSASQELRALAQIMAAAQVVQVAEVAVADLVSELAERAGPGAATIDKAGRRVDVRFASAAMQKGFGSDKPGSARAWGRRWGGGQRSTNTEGQTHLRHRIGPSGPWSTNATGSSPGPGSAKGVITSAKGI
jgi:hypothetical protein